MKVYPVNVCLKGKENSTASHIKNICKEKYFRSDFYLQKKN